jgi:hypothetical protein
VNTKQHETRIITARDQEGRPVGYLAVCRQCAWSYNAYDDGVARMFARDHEKRMKQWG